MRIVLCEEDSAEVTPFRDSTGNRLQARAHDEDTTYLRNFLSDGSHRAKLALPINRVDLTALIVITPGTTPLTKACRLSHAKMCAAALVREEFFHFGQGAVLAQHIYGLHACAVKSPLASQLAGGSLT